ncbi:MAG: hypothetical protein ACOYXT_09065 [Bacteroidota bacterium]
MNKGLKILKWVAFGALGILAVLLFGWIFMALWNWLVPKLFNGPVVSYWEAMGLLLLSKIIFGFGGKGGSHGGRWKQRYYQNKISSMTPEERERFKSRMREKWCMPDKDTSGPESGASNV